MVAYYHSIYFEKVLHTDDVFNQYCLRTCKLQIRHLAEARFSKTESSLKQAEQALVDDTFKIFTGIEKKLTPYNKRRLGQIIDRDITGKLHSGWSLNKQIATGTHKRDGLRKTERYRASFIKLTTLRAGRAVDCVMPG